MDREVPEQPAGRGDVRLVRRRRVMSGKADGVERPKLTRFDQPAGLAIAGIEAALEAELEGNPGPLDVRCQGDRVAQVEGQRLFAERRQAVGQSGTDELGVGVRRRGDNDRLGAIHGLVD